MSGAWAGESPPTSESPTDSPSLVALPWSVRMLLVLGLTACFLSLGTDSEEARSTMLQYDVELPESESSRRDVVVILAAASGISGRLTLLDRRAAVAPVCAFRSTLRDRGAAGERGDTGSGDKDGVLESVEDASLELVLGGDLDGVRGDDPSEVLGDDMEGVRGGEPGGVNGGNL